MSNHLSRFRQLIFKMNENIAICIASGPSLTQDDIDYCRGKGKVYVVNETHQLAPWADVLYAADGDWWDKNPDAHDFAGEKWTCSLSAAEKYDLFEIGVKCHWHWSKTPGVIASGGNSGFQAVNMAYLDGATKIILLGYDMGHKAGSKKHFFEDKDAKILRQSNYAQWIKRFAKAAEFMDDLRVINCSRETNLECFERTTLQDII